MNPRLTQSEIIAIIVPTTRILAIWGNNSKVRIKNVRFRTRECPFADIKGTVLFSVGSDPRTDHLGNGPYISKKREPSPFFAEYDMVSARFLE